jgi:hypothetical protein
MKKNNLIVLTVLFSICLLIFACRRDINNIINDRQEAPSPLLESAKVWYGQHLDTDVNAANTKLIPFWKESWTMKSTAGKNLVLVPAADVEIGNENYTMNRFFVFSASGNDVTNGEIVELLGYKYNVKNNADLLLKNYDQPYISGFTGSILRYDINYTLSEGVAFENGKKNDAKVSIKQALDSTFVKTTGKKPNLQTSTNCTAVTPMNVGFPSYVAPNGCYFIWSQSTNYSGGCPISVTNTYLNTVCPGDGSSGGGGSGSGSGDGSGLGNIILPPLDVSALGAYPKFKALASDLPGFLKKYPNVTKALAYYTGFTEAQIITLMQPGKGPKVIAVPNLKNPRTGNDLYGEYDPATKTISINANFAKGFEVAQSENTIQATGLLLAITTLHEFVHYGRDVNKLTDLVDNNEAGFTFEMNIDPKKTGIEKNNAVQWIYYYPYNFK